MKRSIVACLCFAALVLAAPSIGLAQGTGQRAKATNVPEIPFESVPNFLQMPPDVYLGESMGVARNSKGNLWVFHRRDDTRLFEFDPAGKFVREWGVGIYGFEFAHKVRVDSEDNVWAVDEGDEHGHQVQPPRQGHDGAGPPSRGRRRHRPNAAGRSAGR